MVKFKDLVKKAADVAGKALDTIKEELEFEKMLSDFDEFVANTITDILSENGYRGMGQGESGDYYVVNMAVMDQEKVKHIIDREIMRVYSPKDREKIINVIPDKLTIMIRYTGKGKKPVLLTVSRKEDVSVNIKLSYIVERKGGFFSRVKRDIRTVSLGGFSFSSMDYVDYDNKTLATDKLKEYLSKKLSGMGLI